MHNYSKRVIPIVFLVLLTASAAIAQSPWTGQTFLSDYSHLKPLPSKTGQDFSYIAPGAEDALAHFSAVMVDEPEVSISPQSPYTSAKPDDLKAIADMVRTDVADRMKAWGYQVVDKPGDGVLYLRLGLTDLQLKKKKRGLLAYTPIGFVVNAGVKALQDLMEKIDIIDLTVQAEVANSITREVLGAIVIKRGNAAEAAAKDEKPERITFEDFKVLIADYSDRLACRVANSRLPPNQRVDCTDPKARATLATAPPAPSK